MPLTESMEPISMTAVCFWIVYLCGICAAIMYPVLGVVLYILVYHLNPEYQWWGGTVQAVGLRTSLTVAVATMFGVLLQRPRFEGGARQFPLPIVAFALLVVYALASLALGTETSERGVFQAEKAVKVLIFVLILIRCVRHPQHYQMIIGAWLLGVLYTGYQAWGDVGAQWAGRLSHGIGGPDFAEASDLSVHLVATLPMAGALFFMSRSWWGRGFALVTGALAVNAIILTRTRNAVVGIAAMAIAAAFSLPRGYRLKGWAAILVGCFLAVQLTDPGWWDRMGTIFHYKDDPAAMKRLDYWQAAAAMAIDYPLGIGIGNFHETVRRYVPGLQIQRSAHNTYMACLAELGYPGFMILMIVIVTTLLRLTAIRRTAGRLPSTIRVSIFPIESRFHLGWHAMALRTGLVGYLACGMFTTRLWAEDFWILIGMAAALWNVTQQVDVTLGELKSMNDAAPTRRLPAALRPAAPALATLEAQP